MSLIPAVERQSQVGLCEFMASLVYILRSRTAKAMKKGPVLKGGGG